MLLWDKVYNNYFKKRLTIMETYTVLFNEDNQGVYAISLVNDPAIGVNFITLSNQKELKLATVNEEQRILMGAILIPEQPIYRNQDGKEFNIVFPKETIKQVQQNFALKGYQNNSTLEHSGKQIENVTFVESWIKEDDVHDKSVHYGFNEPVGSWFGLMKINNDVIWNEYVKTGKVKGFSIDGVFDMQKINLKNETMNLETIVNAIKDGFASVKLSEQVATIELATMKLKDGITVLEAESFEVGKPVFIVAENGDKTPLEVGDYDLEDGTTLSVTEVGIIGEIATAQAETSEEEVAMETMLTKLAGEVDLTILTKAVKMLFNDRFSWEISNKKRETEMQELIPAMATTMSVEVAKQIETVRTELSAKIAETKNVEVQASTKSKPNTFVEKNYSEMTNLEKLKFNRNN